ncbi:MAG: hypothetical protein ABI947_14300 [Chloroflexota bacterium]
MITRFRAPVRLLFLFIVVFILLFVSVRNTLLTSAVPAAAEGAGAMGIRRTTADIMAEQQRRAAELANRPVHVKNIHRIDRKNLSNDPASPAVATYGNAAFAPAVAVPEPAASSSPRLPQTVGTEFTPATYGASAPYIPPDTMGTVGPTQFMLTINGRFRVFDKVTTTLGALDVDPDIFFSSVITPIGGGVTGSFTSDPHVRYDRLTNRWFIVMIDVPEPAEANNRVLIAVSDNGTITGATVWTFFQFQQNLVSPAGDNGCLSDYPTPGIDVNALYIGANQFCPLNFAGSVGFVVQKSSILGAGPIVVHAFRSLNNGSGAGPYTPQGVDNPDPAATEGYFIGVDNATFGKLDIRRVSNPGSTSPSISADINVTVPATAFPIDVPNSGGAGLDAIEDRLYAATMRNGRLWTAHNIGVSSTGVASGSPTRDAVRWYELTNLTTTPTLVQSGTIFDSAASNPLFYWFGTVMVSGQGHAAFGFSASSATTFASAATTGRLVTDTLGTTEGTPVIYEAGTGSYSLGSGTPKRWGDFSYTSLDPCDDMTMWTIQEYASSTNVWGVRAAQLKAPPPPTTAVADITSVSKGLKGVNITLTGTSVSGSGYYDPGAGYACRLAGSSTGGVIVNSVTYTNPTHITVNISTVGASVGAKNITITNPDGQAKTYTSAFTVTAGRVETVGVFRSSSSAFLLRNSNTTGPADISTAVGASTDLPIVGDWNGDGLDTVGVYRPSTGQFFLTNSNSPGAPIVYSLVLGVPGDQPIAGDWDGNGADGVGVFRPSNGLIYLKNGLTTGFADFQMVLGIPGDIPVYGDWNGNGVDSPGVFRPSSTTFFLTDQVCNCAVTADYTATLGVSGDSPFAGDWNGNGSTGIGVFRPSNGLIYLKNTPTTGFADISLVYGIPNDKPLAGRWAATGGALIKSTPQLAPTFVP